MTVTILLYNKFRFRNLIRSEGNDAMVLLTIFCLALALLQRTCDDFHRQKTFVLMIFSCSPLYSYFYFFSLSYRYVQLLSDLVWESKCTSFSLSTNIQNVWKSLTVIDRTRKLRKTQKCFYLNVCCVLVFYRLLCVFVCVRVIVLWCH